jgi:hypothetical protein
MVIGYRDYKAVKVALLSQQQVGIYDKTPL